MVYCGKPSKGCQSCRDRKTRCDKALPSCSQCIRANRPCPGYRSQLDLMFRNESTAVIDKAKSREKAKAKARSEATSSQPTPAPQTAPPSSSSDANIVVIKDEGIVASRFRLDTAKHGIYLKPHIPNLPSLTHTSLFPTLEERSLSYFSKTSPRWFRNFDLVDTIVAEAAVTDEHLLASMSAVGLASFSTSVNAPELMIRARRDYGTALQLTNAALRNPTEVKKDSTLFAVMILSIFETITGNNERSLAAWAEHINGAAALVKLRGEEQFSTLVGQKMFMQVTSNLMLSCIQRTLPMPHHIVSLRKSAEHFIDADNPTWRLTGIIIDLTVLRASIQDKSMVEPREIIDAALEIDSRFIELFTNLPNSWDYHIMFTDESPHLIWNGSYHVYSDFWVANIWNGMRTCRVLLHEIIRTQLVFAIDSASLSPIYTISETIAQNEASETIMCAMRDDILGSVPHHTLVPTISGSHPTTLNLEGSKSYFVLWPLYLAGAMDLTTNEIREWAIQKLRDIGMSVGLRQAVVVADFLESGKHIEAWHRDGPGSTSGLRTESLPPRPINLKAFFEGLRSKELGHDSTTSGFDGEKIDDDDNDLYDF